MHAIPCMKISLDSENICITSSRSSTSNVTFWLGCRDCEFFSGEVKRILQLGEMVTPEETKAAKLVPGTFLTEGKRALVEGVISSAFQTLSVEEQNLDSISEYKELMLLGIGMHHAGMQPFLKELTEILFQNKLMKARAQCLLLVT